MLYLSHYLKQAEQTARRIVQLREQLREAAQGADRSVNMLKLMDHLYERPVINVKAAQDALGVSFPAAGRMLNGLQENGILVELTGGRRNRMFRFAPYLDLFEDVTEPEAETAVVQPTQNEENPQ